MTALFILTISYLLGAVPTGLLIARLRGVDLRSTGSGNIGATNVLRSVGKKEAVFTLVIDILKGTAGVLLMRLSGHDDPFIALAGLLAVLGHNFPVFLRFKGGKGVATSIGALLGYSPYTGLITIILWLLVALVFRYSSLGALASFTLLPLNMLIFHGSTWGLILAFTLTTLIYIRHIDNIRRILEGKEPKIGRKR